MSNACSNVPPTTPDNVPAPGSTIAERVRKFYDNLFQRTGVMSNAAEIELRLQQEYAVLINAAAHIPVLKNFNKVTNMLAASLGWKSMVWQAATRGMTEAGATRYAIMDKARVASNLIETAAVYKAIPEIKQLFNNYRRLLPNKSEEELQTLLYDHVIVGQFPRLLNVADSPVVQAQLSGKYIAHVNRLTEAGLLPEQIESLDQLAGSISSHFDNLRQLASRNGLDIELMQNGGYFPVMAQENIRKFLETSAETAGFSKRGMFVDTADYLRATRASNVPVILDLEKMAELLHIEPMHLANYLSEPGTITGLINENFTAEQITKMIDGGILTQMPALSDELTSFFEETLDLPLEGLAEAIVLNPVEAIQAYAVQLKSAAKTSSVMQTLLTDGMDAGWVIDAATLGTRNNTSDYVRIGSDNVLRNLLQNDQGLATDVASLYIHRTALTQAKAILGLNSSWADLGVFGRASEAFFSFFRKSAILGSGVAYIQRVMMQNAISLFASNGSLSHLGVAHSEVMRTFWQKSLDSLDNTETFATIGGKDYTLQELFLSSVIKRGTDAVSGAADQLDKLQPNEWFKSLHPVSLERFIRFNREYATRYGSPVSGLPLANTAALAKEMASNVFNGAYASLAFFNQTLDFTYRWAAIRDLATDSQRTFTDLDDLLRYTDEFFGIQEDTGNIGQIYGAVGQPFASFALAAPGSALRYTVAHPWRAGRTAMLYAQSNAGNDLTDAEMRKWQKDQGTIVLFTDPETGKRYSITPGSVDFYKSSYDWFNELAEDIGRTAGLKVGSIQEQVEQEQNPMKPLSDFVSDTINNSYFGKPVAALLGLDPDTFEPMAAPAQDDTILGLPVTKQLRSVLVSAFPLLRTADENLPSSIVGARQEQKPDTLQIVKPGQAGWLGFVPTSGGSKRKFVPDPTNQRELVAWFLNKGAGLSLSEIDPQKNMISNYNDFTAAERELSSAINNIGERLLTNELTPQQRIKLASDQNNLMRMQFFLAYQRYLIDDLARTRGITSPSATKIIQQRLGKLSSPEDIQKAKSFVDYYNLGE